VRSPAPDNDPATMKADAKNYKLIELIVQLRDHIDMHRIIGLNVGALHETDISRALLGYLQKSAQESLAMYLCKIYESSTRNELNSIPAIIESVSVTALSGPKQAKFAAFGAKYGNHCEATESKSYLKGTFGLFCGIHSRSLDHLKEFRDKIGAHADSKASIKDLPSHAEFEALYGFAYDFYVLVSDSVTGFGPATFTRSVGPGFVRLAKSLGAERVRFDFDEEG
jgi:hypothetical protein